MFHCETGFACRFGTGPDSRVSGLAPGRSSHSSFTSFRDPDGNGWLLQEVTKRSGGRIDSGETCFGSTSDLAGALRRAIVAHGAHERHTGEEDTSSPDWYEAYIVAENSGSELPT
ncbi:MAG TPA: hypothetical protein VED59_09575 [Acidimicrobiales bacterium]|nr:hypothetical protein [Acidimicrobiales bacterium]